MVEKKVKESKVKGNSLGASGFTLAITSVLIIFFGMFGIIVMPVLGFIFCLIQQKKNPTKLGKAGLIISIISFVLILVYIFYLAPLLLSYIQSLNTSFPTS